MKGFRQLASYEQLELYYKWRRAHYEEITLLLRESYVDFCENPKSHVIHCSDFGRSVGFPLFVITTLWILSTETYNHWFVIIMMIGFCFLLRYYQSHIIDLTCREYFWDERKNLLHNYIDHCLEETLAASSSEEEDLDISVFYEYCRSNILAENFPYYEKPKRKRN